MVSSAQPTNNNMEIVHSGCDEPVAGKFEAAIVLAEEFVGVGTVAVGAVVVDVGTIVVDVVSVVETEAIHI